MNYSKIEIILTRLEQRRELSSIAIAMSSESGNEPSLTISEQESDRGMCFPKNSTGASIPADPGAVFICDSSGGYNASKYVVPCSPTPYCDCVSSDPAVACASKPQPFDCNAKSVFSCSKYVCPKPFVCKNSTTDYECAGSEFKCETDFQCTAIHVFVCNHEHSCPDKFGCEGGKDCVTPNNCNETYKYGGSNLKPPFKDVLDNPGDFMCGFSMGAKSEDFFCKTDFSCKGGSNSDFLCADGTDFVCGESNQGVFKCELVSRTGGGGFSCYLQRYECNGATVACNPNGDWLTFGCVFVQTTFARCPVSPKECQPNSTFTQPESKPPWEG
jgi:hypothetical protein